MKLGEAISPTSKESLIAISAGLNVGLELTAAIRNGMASDRVAKAVVCTIVSLGAIGAIQGGKAVYRIAQQTLKKGNTP